MEVPRSLSSFKTAVTKPRRLGRSSNLFDFYFSRLFIIFALFLFSFPITHAADNTTAADFTTGFFTDLAPLLSLFGTQFSKQFMSQSIDWADDFLFAMAPLGILTVVVGAIRVSGYTSLRTLIGSAREPASQSEIEFFVFHVE